jgi:prepilin-type processing-associated H-X9-DG protein
MYANEAPEELYPKFGWDIPIAPIGPNDIANREEPGNLIFYFGPYVPQIFPEYLTDPEIFWCPSDPGGRPDDAPEDEPAKCIGYSPQRDLEGDGYDACEGDGCMGSAGASYTYLGWLIDKADDDDLISDISIFTDIVAAIADTSPSNLTFSQVDASLQPILLFVRWLLVRAMTQELGSNSDPNAAADQSDLDVFVGELNSIRMGNGNGKVVFRLREGVERFLITDINNAASSAKGQSNIPIMYDNISTIAGTFNHVPGGSNVLFLDGHVEFKRYPNSGKAPINRATANFAGAFQDALESTDCL